MSAGRNKTAYLITADQDLLELKHKIPRVNILTAADFAVAFPSPPGLARFLPLPDCSKTFKLQKKTQLACHSPELAKDILQRLSLTLGLSLKSERK